MTIEEKYVELRKKFVNRKNNRYCTCSSSETQGQLVGSIKCPWWKFTVRSRRHFFDPTNCPWVSEDGTCSPTLKTDRSLAHKSRCLKEEISHKCADYFKRHFQYGFRYAVHLKKIVYASWKVLKICLRAMKRWLSDSVPTPSTGAMFWFICW